MESESPEFKNNNPEVIGVNQQFQLFPTDRTFRIGERPDIRRAEEFGPTDMNTISSRHVLRLSEIPDLPFEFQGRRYAPDNKTMVMTPFHPEEGYVIDERDMDFEKRKQKVASMTGKKINSEIDPLWLSVSTPSLITLRKMGILNGNELTPEARAILTRLRLQLQFQFHSPDRTLNFESRPPEQYKDIIPFGGFGRFFPLETGPLPHGMGMPGDFNLRLPDDKKALENIYGRFVLIQTREDESDEPEASGTES